MVGNYLVFEGLLGGALIGLAAALLFILSGRIAGISGIVGGLLNPRAGGFDWRLAFVAGLIAGGFLTPVLLGKEIMVNMQTPWWLNIAGGFLVGLGTRLGSGCTSGHGVCGIARFSTRSITATVTFIVVAMITVYVIRHIIVLGGIV